MIQVDPEDEHFLKERTWSVHTSGYASAVRRINGKNVRVYLHCEIMKRKSGEVIDHKNGDRLDNRRSNLRVVSASDNNRNRSARHARNTSGHRGVHYDKVKGKWRAKAVVNGKSNHLGYFSTSEEASEVVRTWRLANMPGALN